MRRRTRKLIGGAAMLIFVVVYSLLAMVLAQAQPVQNASAIAQAFIYAGLGLGWILPLFPLIRWMEGGEE